MGGIKDFFAMFHRPWSKDDKGGGQQSLEDQNEYDAMMPAINSNNLTSAELGRMHIRTLGVPHCQIKRGRAFCKNVEDMDKARWIQRTLAVPKDVVKEGEIDAILC